MGSDTFHSPGSSNVALDTSRHHLPLLLEALYSQGNLEYSRSEQIKTGIRFSLGSDRNGGQKENCSVH